MVGTASHRVCGFKEIGCDHQKFAYAASRFFAPKTRASCLPARARRPQVPGVLNHYNRYVPYISDRSKVPQPPLALEEMALRQVSYSLQGLSCACATETHLNLAAVQIKCTSVPDVRPSKFTEKAPNPNVSLSCAASPVGSHGCDEATKYPWMPVRQST